MNRRERAIRDPLLLAVVLLATSACAIRGQTPHNEEAAERILRVEHGLVSRNVVANEVTRYSIEERLRFHGVPGVSVAVIDGGRVAWARGWGETEAGTGVPVDTATLFQAASISKPVTAAAALRMAENGSLGLDDDVNRHLRSWKLPENGFTAAEKVTLRRLLSHTAGTTVHGFPGYGAGAELPSLVQVLDGVAPANTAPVRVDVQPGSQFRYSGGGTSIVQAMMSDVSGLPFDVLMTEGLLRPAGMPHSTFSQPLPQERRRSGATGHDARGRAIEGKYNTYPEQAAAGLWTTPSDLARFAIAIQRAYGGEPGALLSPDMARRMLTPVAGDAGLGFFLTQSGGALRFEHGGSNAGFRAYLVALAAGGPGVVVMTNGDAGSDLAMEIVRAVAAEYGIPGYEPTTRDAVPISAHLAAELVGDYYSVRADAPPEPILRIRASDEALVVDIERMGWTARPIRAAPDGTLFFLDSAAEVAIERDAQRITGLLVTGLGSPTRLIRR